MLDVAQTTRLSRVKLVKSDAEKPQGCLRLKRIALLIVVFLPLYVLSTGPVAWANNDAFHRPYLPDEIHVIYWPLAQLTRIECINQFFYWYTAVLWGGFPAGYTTL